MKRSILRLRSTAFLLFTLFLFALLLVNADIAMNGVHRGLSLCLETLIPSLFPFLVLSDLLASSGVAESFGRILRPVSALFGLSAGGSASLLLGSLCGFPVGTTTALSLYRKGEVSKKELERVVLFANNPSSGFLIGAVGEALFGNRMAGVALFFITLLSAATVGILLRILQGKVPKIADIPHNGVKKRLSPTDLTGSIKRGGTSLLQIMAFVLFFSCISECLSAILEGFSLPPVFSVMLCGTLEMTTGISAAVTTLPPAVAFRLTALFASLAGLSVTLQIFSVAEEANLPLSPFLLARLLQGAVALALAELFLFFAKPDFITAESVDTIATAFFPRSYLTALPLFLLLLILIIHFLIKQKSASRSAE